MGTTSPVSVRAAAAANRNVDTARCASTRAVFSGLAASAAIVRARSSSRRRSSAATASSTSARLQVGRTPTAGRAAATARSTSAAPCTGTRPTSEPS